MRKQEKIKEKTRKQEYLPNKLKISKKCVDNKKGVCYYSQADVAPRAACTNKFGGFDYVNIYGKAC